MNPTFGSLPSFFECHVTFGGGEPSVLQTNSTLSLRYAVVFVGPATILAGDPESEPVGIAEMLVKCFCDNEQGQVKIMDDCNNP